MIEVIGKAGITAKIIKDSISEKGVRLVTFQLHYHRYIHSELMTHRVFSRNASSSRAIPVKTLLKQVRENPMMPIHWGSNKPGMQAGDELEDTDLRWVKAGWATSAKEMADEVETMAMHGLHKQVANRLLEPFLAINTLVTSTEWSNWFALRYHKDAQPEIQELAKCMAECMSKSKPTVLKEKEWHLPYVTDEEIFAWENESGSKNNAMSIAIRSSAARCARVSYLNHDKSDCTLEGYFDLFNMLSVRPYDDGKGHVLDENDPVHLSPLEHQATPISYIKGSDGDVELSGITHRDVSGNYWSGSLRGWKQFRQIH